ncbi:hypothetical protein HAX54_052794, partial [Datura stramonium]|nr:hypothetical protein [Datura stramonium]
MDFLSTPPRRPRQQDLSMHEEGQVKNLKSIVDLKEFASSQLDSVKRRVEGLHMETLNDLGFSVLAFRNDS